jgi:hypothetical protein
MLDLPSLPLILFVEPASAVLRCYVGGYGGPIFYAVTITGREVPVR